MYNFEHDATIETMLKYMWMEARKMQVVSQTEVLTRGLEWIRPRVNILIQYDAIERYTYRANRIDTPLAHKLRAICEGLNSIGSQRGVPVIRIAQITQYAESAKAFNFGPFRTKLMKAGNPMLIEWMLALAVYAEDRKEIKQGVKEQQAIDKRISSTLARFEQDGVRVRKAEEEYQRMMDYINTQIQYLDQRKMNLESARLTLESTSNELEALREKHPDKFEDSTERTESD